MKKNYITTKGMERLVAEQDHLLQVERPETVKIVSWAASLGDRSENADYQYGKKRLREIDKRLRFLRDRIASAEVIDPAKQSGERIKFGATITLEDESGRVKSVSIVGIDESSPAEGRVSWASPLGSVLLGKSLGDEISFNSPHGEVYYMINNIDYREIFVPEWTPSKVPQLSRPKEDF